MKIVTIIGARPQFVKAAAFSRAIARHNDGEVDPIEEILVHTGQHYDANMSDIFFEELGIPTPRYNLGIGSGSHAEQTGSTMIAVEGVLRKECPDVVVVFGDTNATLAGTLAATKMHIPVAHIEAGLRSYNRRMPEETNRVLTDHASSHLFCPTETALENLRQEGIEDNAYIVGDIMLDCYEQQRCDPAEHGAVLDRLGLFDRFGQPISFYLATVHRAENTDNLDRMAAIFDALGKLGRRVLLPLHPRTARVIEERGIDLPSTIQTLAPLPYREICILQRSAHVILTDSGGLQKEAYFSQTPCVTMRDETEWVETVHAGWNKVAGASTKAILDAVAGFEACYPTQQPPLYGEGDTAARIVSMLSNRAAQSPSLRAA
jgi:UDP-GlcNAc3NAcA epimerase